MVPANPKTAIRTVPATVAILTVAGLTAAIPIVMGLSCLSAAEATAVVDYGRSRSR
jgi:hypothetical protein